MARATIGGVRLQGNAGKGACRDVGPLLDEGHAQCDDGLSGRWPGVCAPLPDGGGGAACDGSHDLSVWGVGGECGGQFWLQESILPLPE